MLLISHRGNLFGPNEKEENKPQYIDQCIQNYDCEVDFWAIGNKLFLGHDFPNYEISFNFLIDRIDKLWIHCKNIESLEFMDQSQFNYFWHNNDKATITSHNYIWAYPNIVIKNSIAVLPELHNTPIINNLGICTDWIKKYEELN